MWTLLLLIYVYDSKLSSITKVCRWGLLAIGYIANTNADNQLALRDHIDVIVRALGQHIDNAEVG